jgi:hypothetical protein
MKELNRIVVGFTELRIMEGNKGKWCEIFESGNWNRISATTLHQLSFDKRIYNWLNQHYYSLIYMQKFPGNNTKTSL